jgi:hypothetical protein
MLSPDLCNYDAETRSSNSTGLETVAAGAPIADARRKFADTWSAKMGTGWRPRGSPVGHPEQATSVSTTSAKTGTTDF